MREPQKQCHSLLGLLGLEEAVECQDLRQPTSREPKKRPKNPLLAGTSANSVRLVAVVCGPFSADR